MSGKAITPLMETELLGVIDRGRVLSLSMKAQQRDALIVRRLVQRNPSDERFVEPTQEGIELAGRLRRTLSSPIAGAGPGRCRDGLVDRDDVAR